MNKTLKIILFIVGMYAIVTLIAAIIWSFVNNAIGTSPNSLLNILVFLGRFMWAILPILIFVFLIYKEKKQKKKLSDTQKALKIASIWFFIILALMNIITTFF